MGEFNVMAQVETISRAEAARRLGVHRSMIGRYAQQGMPTAADGSVLWPAALEWRKRNTVPERSGSFYARQRQKLEQPDPDTEHGETAGARMLAHHVCRNLRDSLPELLHKLSVKGLGPQLEGIGPGIIAFALPLCLVESWYEDLIDGMKPLPEIPWRKLYGKKAGVARAFYEELRAFWEEGDSKTDRERG